MRISINTFSIFTILPLVGITNAVVAFVLFSHSNESQIEQFLDSHMSNARSLSPTLGFTIWEFNVERANNTLLGLDTDEAFRFARLNADGMGFAEHGNAADFDDRLENTAGADWTPAFDAHYVLTDSDLIIRQPVVVIEKDRQVGELFVGYSLDALIAGRRTLASQIITISTAGTLIVFLGVLGYAKISNRWLNRVGQNIKRLANGELAEPVASRTPIAEFQDIDAALRQLRLDALELIELQSKARSDERIRYMAMHDPLTDLFNRRWLDEFPQQLVKDGAAASGWLEVLHIDLDGFKEVNDHAGHHAGDKVLRIAGERLRLLRTGGRNAEICRIGGDEFVVICRHDTKQSVEAAPLALAQDVVARLAEAYPLQTSENGVNSVLSNVSASVGVAIAPLEDLDLKSVLQDADMAMYAAKAKGKNDCVLFTPALRNASTERSQLISDLEEAIRVDALVPFYQAKVDSKSFALCGAEALVRWPHPTRGLVSPARFMGLAEERGLLRQIDRMMFRQVCADVQRWENEGYEFGRVSINLSGDRLLDPNLLKELEATSCDLSKISFELLETIYLDDISNDVSQRLDDIRSFGILIELDDFGSGHASMVSLLEIAPDRLKLDQLLVRQLNSHTQSERFLSQIVGIGKSLGIPATAEGVEELEQAHMLAEMGCDVLQGYYFGRPVPAETFMQEFLANDDVA